MRQATQEFKRGMRLGASFRCDVCNGTRTYLYDHTLKEGKIEGLVVYCDSPNCKEFSKYIRINGALDKRIAKIAEEEKNIFKKMIGVEAA